MAVTLRDFIAHREGEIRDLQKALKAELRELQVAKAALEAQVGPPSPASSGNGQAMTIKDMAREVLSGQPNGLNSSGILDGIKKMFGREVERTSLSPQLSRLKDEGELILSGDVWFTKTHHAAHMEQIFKESSNNMAVQSAFAPGDAKTLKTPPARAAWDDDLEDVPF